MRQTTRSAPQAARSPYPFAWAALAVAAAAAIWLGVERSDDTLSQAPPRIIEATELLRRQRFGI
jgi:hypothetical protein